MLDKLRWKLAAKFMELAHNYIDQGGAKNIKLGLGLVKVAVKVMPYDEVMLAYMKASWGAMIANTLEKQES